MIYIIHRSVDVLFITLLTFIVHFYVVDNFVRHLTLVWEHTFMSPVEALVEALWCRGHDITWRQGQAGVWALL